MDVVSYATCFHCLLVGHWAKECQLLTPAENRAEHLARLDEFKRRFLEFEISPPDKQRMIKHENALWKEKENTK